MAWQQLDRSGQTNIRLQKCVVARDATSRGRISSILELEETVGTVHRWQWFAQMQRQITKCNNSI